MINPVRIVTGLYARLTRLFPREFQQNFGEELQDVFGAMTMDAIQTGGALSLTSVCLKELGDLPGNLLHEHLNNLRKILVQKRVRMTISPLRSATWGSIGFGVGFGLLIVIRWLFDPQNNIMFRNFRVGLMRETILCSAIAVLGWLSIGLSTFSLEQIKKCVVTSLLLGALGGFLDNTFVHFSFTAIGNRVNMVWYLGSLVQLTGSLIFGAFLGAVFGFLDGQLERFIPKILLGSACLGISYLIGEGVFRLLSLIPFSWRMQHWVIPLATSAAIIGMVDGALLGWFAAREKPRQPSRRTVKMPAWNI